MKNTRKRFFKNWEDPDFYTHVYEYMKEGHTEKGMCELIGVNYKTYRNHKLKDKLLRDTVKRGKDAQNRFIYQKAESALHKLISGYEFVETKKVVEKEKKDGSLTVTKTTTTEHKKQIAPNCTAIMYKLGNLSKLGVGEYQSVNNIVNEIDLSKNMNFKLSLEDENEDEDETFDFDE